MTRRIPKVHPILLLLLLVGVACMLPPGAAGQGMQGSGLGRAYWHVFVAYAIAWALVLGWVVSIARRLARIERRLGDGDPEGT